MRIMELHSILIYSIFPRDGNLAIYIYILRNAYVSNVSKSYVYHISSSFVIFHTLPSFIQFPNVFQVPR